MAAGKGKTPLNSVIGHQMAGIAEKLKSHASKKKIGDALGSMHDSVAKKPTFGKKAGLLKTAYYLGVKAAEDSVSMNSEDNPSTVHEHEPEEEKVITSLRRGWPDPLAEAQKGYKGKDREIYDEDQPSEYDWGDVKSRNQINYNSPDVTV